MAVSVPTDPDYLALQAALAGENEYSTARELGRGAREAGSLARSSGA